MAKPPGSEHDQTSEQRETLNRVRDCREAAEKLVRQYRNVWEENYGLWLSTQQIRNSLSGNVENDRDVTAEAQRLYGAHLFIPWVYATIETVLPRILSNNPKMLILANTPEAKDALEPLKQRFAYDQNRINYELELQKTARRGFVYGLGVQKTYWCEEYRTGRYMEPSQTDSKKYVPSDRKPIKVYEGPQSESVDIFDFFWDPAALSMKSCRWVIHRTWRDMAYIREMVEAGKWNNIDLDRVDGMGTSAERTTAWAGRRAAEGISNLADDQLHEVWEYHDREKVCTVLDQTLLVQEKPNPFYHGDLPFHIFRPTINQESFVGVGEVDPIKHLQYELNTLRNQRRDAATVALNRGFFYQQGSIEDDNLIMGPGIFTEVFGDPNEAIFPMPIADLPASGYQEEEAIKSDMERTSGVSDPATGSEASQSAGATATGLQLVQAAANERIKLKSKNLATETIRGEAGQWKEMYRQYGKTETMRVPGQPPGSYEPAADASYSFMDVGPEHYNADYEVIPEGGSTEADSEIQKQQAALQRYQTLANNPDVNQRKNTEELLKDYGVARPEEWLTPPPPEFPEIDLQVLQQGLESLGMKPEQLSILGDIVQQAVAAAAQQNPNNPTAQQEPLPDASQNGAAPEEPVPAQ